MRNVKTKLASILIALTCVFACLGVSLFVSNYNATEAKASDYTTYTITKAGASADSDSTMLYLHTIEGDQLPEVDEDNWDWENLYEFEEGSGAGITLNGEAVPILEMLLPCDFYLYFDNDISAVEGDVFSIDGAFYSEEAGIKVVFVNCSLQFDGSAWVAVEVEDPVVPPVDDGYTTHNIGALTLHVNSKSYGGAGSVHNQIYLARADEGDLPVQSWDIAFVADSAENIKLNGENFSALDVKSTDAGFWFNFSRELNAGEYITISGTFTCEAEAVKYVVEESSFIWTGSEWQTYVVVNYTTYTVTKIGANNDASNASTLYLYSLGGDELPKEQGDWDNRYTLEVGSGNGVTINDEVVDIAEVKMPGDLYLVLSREAVAGDVLVLDGAFYNDVTAFRLVFDNCTLKFDGSAWVEVVDEDPVTPPVDVEFTTHNIGALTLHVNSKSYGGAGSVHNQIYLARADEGDLPVQNWDIAFVADSAENIKLNGENFTALDVKSTDAGFWFNFSRELNAGEYITISGTFTCEAEVVKYVVEESSFIWTGSEWQVYVPTEPIEYTTYTVTRVGATGDSDCSILYLYSDGGDELPKELGDWDNLYTLEEGSGAGFTLNGEVVAVNEMKMPGDLYVVMGMYAEAGDVLVIDGAYICEEKAIRLVFVNCELVFDGDVWTAPAIEEPPVEYTTYTVTRVGATGDSDCSVLYLYSLGGDELPKEQGDWDNLYTLEEGSGAGFTLNGEVVAVDEMKMPGDLYVIVAMYAEAGDVLVIDGAYICEEKAIRLVFVNCELAFDGDVWTAPAIEEPPVEYTTYEIGALTLHVNSKPIGGAGSLHNAVYLARVDEEAFPLLDWEKPFVAESAENFKLNGEAFAYVKAVSTTDGFYWDFGRELEAGDCITIGGVFVCEIAQVKYVIEESSFVWTGTEWQVYVPAESIEYTTYTVTRVGATGDSDCSILYLYSAGGDALPKELGDWDNLYTLEEGSGAGFTLNGEVVAVDEMKMPGDLYVLVAMYAEAGDVLVIDGAYICEEKAIRLVFVNCELVFDGDVWTAPAIEEPPVEYTTYEIGALTLHVNSVIGPAKDFNHQLYLARADEGELPVISWDFVYTANEDAYIKVNGELTTFIEMKVTDGGIFLAIDALEPGDVFTIGGSFTCDALGTIYIIEESSFEWTDKWTVYVEYTYVEVCEMVAIPNSSSNTALYFHRADDQLLPVDSWDYVFTFRPGSGSGLTLNGEPLDTLDIKSPGGNIYIGLGVTVQEGDRVTIEGTYLSPETQIAYVIPASTAIYTSAGWVSELDLIKEEYIVQLENYITNFDSANYYDTEWAFMEETVEEGCLAISRAASRVEVAILYEEAVATLNEVFTKDEADARIDELKVTYKENLEVYKNEEDYRAAEWEVILAIIADAHQAIDASVSVTELNRVVADAKAAMDSVKTDEQMLAEEAEVAQAKEELLTYKNEEDYRASEWAEIQAIIEDACDYIDDSIGDSELIAKILADAKTEIDHIKTKEVAEADDAVVLQAKEELASYKSEDDYYAEEWAEIQAIINAANAAIDKAIGDEEAIGAIVEEAKAEIDEVMVKEEADAADFAQAKADAKKEVRDYYAALDHDNYSDDAEVTLSQYVSEAIAAIENATTVEEMQEAVDTFKANADSVEKLVDDEESTSSESSSKESSSKGGCSSSVAGGLISLTPALALAFARISRKRKED